MKTCKIGVLGNFGDGINFNGGQIIKTNIFFDALVDKFGAKNISKLNTHKIKFKVIPFMFKMRSMFKKNDIVVLILANNGIRYLLPFILYYQKKYGTKVYYNAVGGWLAEHIKKHPKLAKISRIDKIFVETNSTKRELTKININNVVVLKNFKYLEKVELPQRNDYKTIKLCFFSRVNKKKGVEDAIKSVNRANKYFNKQAYKLDIYGPIEKQYEKRFLKLIKENGDNIKYKGVVEYFATVETIKNYHFQIFPTKYFTEGIPGSIIDSFYAGVPVISSKWESFDDVLNEGMNGLGYEFNDIDSLYKLLIKLYKEPEIIKNMKKEALASADKYSPESVMNDFYNILFK